MATLSLLILHEGLEEPRFHDAREDHTIEELLQLVAPDDPAACAYLADADEPLDAALTLLDAGLTADSEITVARRHQIDVTVRYAGRHLRDERPPNQRLRRVRRWALGERGFDIPEGQWDEFELADPVTDEPVNLRSTIAQYVRDGKRKAVFDLRLIKAPQGSR